VLASHRGGNGAIRGAVGDAFERVGYARDLKDKLVNGVGPFQNHNAFAAEVEGHPEDKSGDERKAHHQQIMARKDKRSSGDGNDMVREQDFLPAGALKIVAPGSCPETAPAAK
jgi:hypothetical protein